MKEKKCGTAFSPLGLQTLYKFEPPSCISLLTPVCYVMQYGLFFSIFTET